jgi:hypothetical protein
MAESKWIGLALLGVIVAACGGGSGASASNGGGGSGGSGADTTGSTGASMSTGSTTGSGGAGGGGGAIGEWMDAPGACPAGVPQVDLKTTQDLADASRGEGTFANDAPGTCYFIHDGTYTQSGVLLYFTKGGAPGARRYFVGESRKGVVIQGRASIDDGVGELSISNLTMDITGYAQAGSFNTLSVGNGKNITIDHVTFTGDCATGLKGGHIETNGTDGLLVEACLIEKFGHCGGGGHEDHGIYLASGKNIVVRNSVIRENSSRGIQMYTQGGQYGTLDQITIERNRIQANGHADYEDGIVINAYDTGTISNVTIKRNIIDHNFYSGIRFAGGVESGVVVTYNTFDSNGAGSNLAGRSEINVDDMGGAAGTSIKRNIFNVGNLLINDCYDATSLGFGLADDFVHGKIPSGAAGNCVGMETSGDPQFKDAAAGDYHPQNAEATGFGVYAP